MSNRFFDPNSDPAINKQYRDQALMAGLYAGGASAGERLTSKTLKTPGKLAYSKIESKIKSGPDVQKAKEALKKLKKAGKIGRTSRRVAGIAAGLYGTNELVKAVNSRLNRQH